MFGNVSDTDAKRLVAALPFICAENGSVIWTRHRRQPDLTPSIRAWLIAAGFEERAFVSHDADQFAVGWSQMAVARSEGALPEPLFTFVR